MPSTRHPRRTSRPRRLADRLVSLVPIAIALATLGAGLLAESNGALDGALWLLVVGWVLLTPLSALLLWDVDLPAVDPGWTHGSAAEDVPTTDGPLATLRERFASGEIDHEEFERRLDDLLGSAAEVDLEAETDVDARTDAAIDGTSDGVVDARDSTATPHDSEDRDGRDGRDRNRDDAGEFEFRR